MNLNLVICLLNFSLLLFLSSKLDWNHTLLSSKILHIDLYHDTHESEHAPTRMRLGWRLQITTLKSSSVLFNSFLLYYYYFFLYFSHGWSQIVFQYHVKPLSTHLLPILTYLIYITFILTDFLLVPKKGAMASLFRHSPL